MRRLLLGTMCMAASLLLSAQAAIADTTGNLLRNPGAEDSRGASNFTTTAAPSGWQTTSSFSAVKYAALEDQAPARPPAGGSNYFAGGPYSAQSIASQRVDVSAYEQQIDAGSVLVDLSAFIGGWDGQDDSGSVTATFFRADGYLIDELTLRGPHAADRGSKSVFLLVHNTGELPELTRSIVVTMSANRAQGDYNDADFDNLNLNLLVGPSPPIKSHALINIKRRAGFVPSKATLRNGGIVKFCNNQDTIAHLFSYSKGKELLFYSPFYEMRIDDGDCFSRKLRRNSTGKPILLQIRGDLLIARNVKHDRLVLRVLP